MKKTVVALVTAVLMLFTSAQPAQAAGVNTITGAVRTAYGAYILYVQGQIALVAATQAIIQAIIQARTEILNHIDDIATASVRACARAAVIDAEDIPAMTTDTLQAFARDATNCVTSAEALIGTPNTSLPAIDQLGFALNTVGPVALLARTRAGFSTSALRTTIVGGDNALITKLEPHCFATPLTGDQEPGELLEWLCRCTAYNGDTGVESHIGRVEFTVARQQAMRNTSYPVAKAALEELT